MAHLFSVCLFLAELASILGNVCAADDVPKQTDFDWYNTSICSTISTTGPAPSTSVTTTTFENLVSIATTSIVQPVATESDYLATVDLNYTSTIFQIVYGTTYTPSTVISRVPTTVIVGTLSRTTTIYLTGTPSLYTVYDTGSLAGTQSVWAEHVECTVNNTLLTMDISTRMTTTVTTTITPINTVSTIITTRVISLPTSTADPAETALTITTTETIYAAATNVTTVTENEAPGSVGTVYNMRCHPTALISNVLPTSTGGPIPPTPLAIPSVVGSAARVYLPLPTRDASACCQLCLDNQGCAGVVDTPENGPSGLCEFYMVYSEYPPIGLNATVGQCGTIVYFPPWDGQVDNGIVYADGCAMASIAG
ncbi:MAG: hypothetical protein Q9227_007773 [Pyrenula ochraceoflavens]